MKPGLLLKEAPEPRFELFCENYVNHKKCNLLFNTTKEFEQHQLEVHNLVYGKFYVQQSWYNIERTQCKEFTRLTYNLPLRPVRRFNVTFEMIEHIGGRTPGHQKCWCGKPKELWDSRHFQTYCSDAHRDQWWELTDYVGPHKNKFLNKNEYCEYCGTKGKRSWNNYDLEMDHIIAIVFGGHPWDYRNLQALCSECHKKKTAIDVKILAWWKRECKYDVGPIIPNPQLTLDDVFEYEYAYN